MGWDGVLLWQLLLLHTSFPVLMIDLTASSASACTYLLLAVAAGAGAGAATAAAAGVGAWEPWERGCVGAAIALGRTAIPS